MKALSIRADYATDILTGEKTQEFRSWSTDYRGDLLICSTQKKIPGSIPGHALCVARIESIEKTKSGGFAWNLGHIKAIEPFKVKGQQGLFNVDDSLIHVVELENNPDMPEDKALEWITEHIKPLIV